MSRRSHRSALALTAAAVVAGTMMVAAPAHAAPWDGNDIVFGPGDWDANTFRFTIDDVRLVLPTYPVDPSRPTDIWDYTGQASITASGLSISDEPVGCEDASQIDVGVEAGTGDLVYTCTSPRAAYATAGLTVFSEIRIYDGGEIVRALVTITNTTDAPVTIDEIEVETNFGSTGFLYDYDGQSDAVLAVPAPEGFSTDYAGPLNTADAKWIVHWNEDDAPGGLIIGNSRASVVADWDRVVDDIYDASIGPFEIPAGESRTVLTFSTWAPQPLIAGNYTNNNPPAALLNESADAIVAQMAQFSELSGALLVGIVDPAQVINWGPADEIIVPEPEVPELAETGAGDVGAAALAAVILGGLGALLLVRRRARV